MNSKETEDLNVLFTFRKTLLVSVLYMVGVTFRLKGFIDGGQFVDLIKNVTISFLASNSLEYMTSTARTYFNSSPTTNSQGIPVVQDQNTSK